MEKLVEHSNKFESILEGLKFALAQMEENEKKLLSTVTQMVNILFHFSMLISFLKKNSISKSALI